MPMLNKIMLYLLVLTVPTSVWPDLMGDCASQENMQIEMKMGDGHVHPSSGVSEFTAVVHHELNSNSEGEKTGISNSECCDDCITLCATFAGNLATRISTHSNAYYDSHRRLNISPTEFHTSPPPHSLFRPPISLV